MCTCIYNDEIQIDVTSRRNKIYKKANTFFSFLEGRKHQHLFVIFIFYLGKYFDFTCLILPQNTQNKSLFISILTSFSLKSEKSD